MLQALMYTTPNCPFCVRAKELLKKKNIPFEEVRIDQEPDRRQEMLEKSAGRRTVPQIFLNDKHVGGFDDLHALEVSGELDAWIAEG